ncbi:MAG: insulinase family protein, partial [Sphingomonadales bacterium]|nr:insulinase family protein [Sphingomonadales bacterium]
DALQSLLAGHTVGFALASGAETFTVSAQTTPADLALQLQLATAYLTDPGYRSEGETLYRQSINTLFARKDATPGSALGAALGGILSDNDPRFTLQPVEAYRALTFAGLRAAIGDRLARGAIEIGIVGDVAEDEAIALVARTLGALPPREPEFRPYAEQRSRTFSPDRTLRVVRHTGPADQAIVRLTWPSRDGEDPLDVLRLELLERVMRIALTERLREELGKAYAPAASSETPRVWPGYGTFAVAASVSLADVPATRAALRATVAELRRAPVSGDLLQRARQPLLESLENALKTNRGWLALVERAQSRPDRIARQIAAPARLRALTGADLQAVAERYLDPAAALEIDVVPAAAPAP